jgi:peptidoglycan/xylan/chitin deacetylase (PgdA/CDA1 family)
MRRRAGAAFVLIAAALVLVLLVFSGGSTSNSKSAAKNQQPAGSTQSGPDGAQKKAAVPAVNPQKITPLVPGEAHVITESTASGREVALTFDDGFCSACVKRIVDVLEQTGAHATFFPNGRYASSWDPQASRIKAMVASGQLTLGNHTFSHGVSTSIGAAAFGEDLQRNEDWIEKTFGVTGRPWFRPPFGDYNQGTLSEAGNRGYTKVVMWSGTVADSNLRSDRYILNAINYWAKPGRIILMHGNYPPTAKVLPQILAMLKKKNLTPVTMAEMAKHAAPPAAGRATAGY